jgi:hypothetical protein
LEIPYGHAIAAGGMHESAVAHVNAHMGNGSRRVVSVGEKNQIAPSKIIGIRNDASISANFQCCAWQCMDADGLE